VDLEHLVTTFAVAGERVVSRDMPHHVIGDQRGDGVQITLAECSFAQTSIALWVFDLVFWRDPLTPQGADES
jgi:hypothetical protein